MDLGRAAADLDLEVVDKRATGGAFWVVGDESIRPKIEILQKSGISLRFSADGGRATSGRPGWYTHPTRSTEQSGGSRQ